MSSREMSRLRYSSVGSPKPRSTMFSHAGSIVTTPATNPRCARISERGRRSVSDRSSHRIAADTGIQIEQTERTIAASSLHPNSPSPPPTMFAANRIADRLSQPATIDSAKPRRDGLAVIDSETLVATNWDGWSPAREVLTPDDGAGGTGYLRVWDKPRFRIRGH